MAKATGKDFLEKLKDFIINNEFCLDELALNEQNQPCSALPRKPDGQDQSLPPVKFSLEGAFHYLEEFNRDKTAVDDANLYIYFASHDLDAPFIKNAYPNVPPKYHAYSLYSYKIGQHFGKDGVVKIIDSAILLAENFPKFYEVIKQKQTEAKKSKSESFILPTKTIEKYNYNSYSGYITIRNSLLKNGSGWGIVESEDGWIFTQLKED